MEKPVIKYQFEFHRHHHRKAITLSWLYTTLPFGIHWSKRKKKKTEKWRLQQRVWYWKIKIDENRKKIFQQHSLAHGARYSTILQQFSITTFQQSFTAAWRFIAVCNAIYWSKQCKNVNFDDKIEKCHSTNSIVQNWCHSKRSVSGCKKLKYIYYNKHSPNVSNYV